MKYRIKNIKGFSLLELLVVVLIIGILAAIALPQYKVAVSKSKAVQAIGIVNNLREAQQRYYMIHGKYALSFDHFDIQITDKANINGAIASFKYMTCNNNATNANGPRALCTLFDEALTIARTYENSYRPYCEVHKNKSQTDLAEKVCIALGGVKSNYNVNSIYYDLP